ncbi:MAG TPA: YqgE/AlgH family protein [candidate division Zixibacteria bacterium]|nr:YqgE/AlgH family protein [candidate division Zixibacteria bacterium]
MGDEKGRVLARWVCFSLLLCWAAVAAPCPGGAGGAGPGGHLTGQLLVATPEMTDPRFVETVIYLVRHDAGGAFGLIINRPLTRGPIKDLLKGFGIESKEAAGEIVLHYGGPVSPSGGFVLHTDDYLLDTSAKIDDGIAMTSDPKMIEAIAAGKGPRRYLLMLGYAGWAPGQLESEIRGQSWFTIPADQSLIFDADAEKKWRKANDRRQFRL